MMSSELKSVAAPAKINLSLRVQHRRADGYHELETMMVPLDLADQLTLQRIDGPDGRFEFTCSEADVPSDDKNLVVQAIRRLGEAHGPFPAMRWHLEKRIPHGAGLGGGSSDAAAALRAANDWLGLGLSLTALHAVAAEIGSDVPFFLHGSAGICRGRGELIDPRPDFQPCLPVLLIKPPFPVPTPWAYQQWASAPMLPGVSYDAQSVTGADGTALTLINDLERPVFAKHLLLADMKMWLLNRPEVAAALMSGSGSTVFAVLHDASPADSLRSALTDEFGPFLWMWQGIAGPASAPHDAA
jgi:4-diphosphocytidyl-2-C-methyl-D-erythritol kinase